VTQPSQVYCEPCRRPLYEAANLLWEQRSPCPDCGSRLRHFELEAFDAFLSFEEHVQTRTRLRWGDGRGGWAVKVTAGDDFHRCSGIWNRLRRVIDRRLNLYEEHIEAPDGSVIRDIREPLDEHQGHGSAKHTRPRPPSA
jgi:hypothetical protein